LRIGLQVPYFRWPGGAEALGETFGGIAARAEEAGFASLWVMDHFFQIPGVGAPEQEMLEGYTALAFAAARTSTIKLGTMVTGVTYRHPGVLVKTATTLDVLSRGRAYFGIGAAWFEREHAGLGVPFPPLRERFERLEETLQITRQMWRGERAPFTGKHYQLAETLCSPLPLSRPHPPVLIGGQGEKRTLRLVALYGDACNIGLSFDDDGVALARHKFAVLRAHCEREDRDYDAIEKTVLSVLWLSREERPRGAWMTPARAAEQIARFAEAGVDHVIISLPGIERPETLELFAQEVMPAVARM
jgi:F420-dependent oxidoreductase-like protein